MDMNGADRSPAMEAVLTTCPSVSCFSISGTKVRMPCTTPHKLTPNPHSQFCNGWVQDGPKPPPTPALLQTICTAPNVSRVFCARVSTDSAFATSVTTPNTDAPFARISSSARRSAPSSTSASTIFIPAAAKRSAIARPIPLAPPVTTATRSANSFMTESSCYFQDETTRLLYLSSFVLTMELYQHCGRDIYGASFCSHMGRDLPSCTRHIS